MTNKQNKEFNKYQWDIDLADYLIDFQRLRYAFANNNCSNCMKNGLAKKRNCSLLKGFKEPICDKIISYTQNKLKKKEKTLLAEVLSSQYP